MSAIPPAAFYGTAPSGDGTTSSTTRADGSRPTTPPTTAPKLQSGRSPVLSSRAASAPYTSQHIWRDQRITAFHQEIAGRVVPVSGVDFLTLIPGGKLKTERLEVFRAGIGALAGSTSETSMYMPWADAMNELCPRLDFVDVHSTATVFEGYEVKPDVNVYPKNSDKNAKNVEMMIEFKFDEGDDPFNDDRSATGFERTTNKARDTLGQITLYATAHQARQFRTHIFSALVFPRYLRLLRWDRSGVIVTEKLDLDQPEAIIFFQRFNDATLEQRGSDASVRSVKMPGENGRHIREQLGCESSDPLLEISVGKNKYIVAESMNYGGAGSPTGRATRSFKAFSKDRKEVVFLKDTWRVLWPTLKPEHETYAKLKASNVQNIAECIDAADILHNDNPNHDTQTKMWADNLHLDLTLREFRHYRLVLEHMDRHLEDFSEVRDLVVAVRDAAEAHRQAAVQAKILHRDISVGNIMMKIKGGVLKGFLIDWDLCRDDSEGVPGEAQRERTGTWQFMAIRLSRPSLGGEPLVPNRVDDVESFLHVLTWMALRYTLHSMSDNDLFSTLNENFDASYQESRGVTRATGAKSAYLQSGTLITDAGFANKGILTILHRLADTLSYRYTHPLDVDERIATKKEVDKYNNGLRDKASALDTLENDDKWLPTTLTNLLDVDFVWEHANNKVVHKIVNPRTQGTVKRKTESELTSAITKSSRLANQTSVHDQEPIPEEILEDGYDL